MTAITGRVALGAAFLDEHDRDWWRADVENAIDLDKLSLASSEMCVLGQRCPLEMLAGYNRVQVDELTEDEDGDRYYALGLTLMRAAGDRRSLYQWATEHGFASTFGGTSGQWGELTDEWKRVFAERRSAA
jgi:hypothetical protein